MSGPTPDMWNGVRPSCCVTRRPVKLIANPPGTASRREDRKHGEQGAPGPGGRPDRSGTPALEVWGPKATSRQSSCRHGAPAGPADAPPLARDPCMLQVGFMTSIFPRKVGLRRAMLAALAVTIAACDAPRNRTEDSAPASQAAFWSQLGALCGKAFGGHVAESVPPDTVMSRQTLVMHVRECGADTIRIPFHVGENRSRTWVITRTATGLRLKHDHRHEDGAPDSVTQYGGDTRDAGQPDRQEFHADSLTAALIPAARTNIWTVELQPGRLFVYALRREGTDRRFRAEFDLGTAVEIPPAPWGTRP